MSEEKTKIIWHNWLIAFTAAAIAGTAIYCHNQGGNIYTQIIAAFGIVFSMTYSSIEFKQTNNKSKFAIPIFVIVFCIYCLAKSI